MIRRLGVACLAAVLMASCANDNDGDIDVSADETTSTTEAATTTTEATTTTAPPTPTPTTAKPAPTTTVKPATTTTAIPASMARVTIVNDYPAAVVVKVNGATHNVARGGSKGPFGVTPSPDGNDTIVLHRADDPTCGLGDAEGYFTAGGTYELRVIVSTPAGCNGDKPGIGGRMNPGNKSI